jgi:hypothetical protein
VGWFVIERVVTLYTVFLMLWQFYRNRGRLFDVMKWLTVKGLGLSASFSGAVVLGSDGFAVWNFPRFLSFQSVPSTVGSSLGATIGALSFGLLGTYVFALGIWVIVPNTAVGRYIGKHFLRRNYRQKGNRTGCQWTALKRNVPAASTLRYRSIFR